MIVKLTKEAQKAALAESESACYRQMQSDENTITGTLCNRTWDNIMCWPDTPAGKIIYQSCPSYINGFNTEQNASRFCLPNGTWFMPITVNGSDSGSTGWTNFMACFVNVSSPEPQDKDPPYNLGVANMVQKHINEFRLMYNIGYALSLVCLLLAVAIMLYFRRLHCARNAIHLNLFLAFILRALMSTIKENLFVGAVGFPVDIGYTENNTMFFKEGSHWECRLFFSLFQYVLTASYIWIFVEGLYLHMLIFVSVFTEKTRIVWYMVFGWSFPIPFVIAWALSRYFIDNTVCWNTSINSVGLTWIMKGPVMLSICYLYAIYWFSSYLSVKHQTLLTKHHLFSSLLTLVTCRVQLNFLFFISIVRVLFTKLTSSHCPESKRLRYRRLARSTLVLIPVFGVYYIVFTFPMNNLDDTTSFIMLFVEMFFNSYQGVIIAIVLCFVNAEVRGEIKKAYRRANLRRNSAVSMNHSQIRNARQSKDGQMPDNCDARGRGKKKRGCLKNDTSITNFDETLPLNAGANENNIVDKDDIQNIEMNGFLPITTKSDERETEIVGKDMSDVKVKINIFNIQRNSKDDRDSTLSSLHIETLKNGTTLNESQHFNNNREKEEIDSFNCPKRMTLEQEKRILVT